MMKQERWTLLNRLHFDAAISAGGRDTAVWWAEQVGVELEDLLFLEDARLIVARHDGMFSRRPGDPEHGAQVKLPRTGDIPARVTLGLTDRGRDWVADNPHNRVLWAAAGHTIPIELGKAIREYDLQLEAVAECCTGGYTTAVWMANDKEVASQPTAAFLRDLLDKTDGTLQAVGLVATARGRTTHGWRR